MTADSSETGSYLFPSGRLARLSIPILAVIVGLTALPLAIHGYLFLAFVPPGAALLYIIEWERRVHFY